MCLLSLRFACAVPLGYARCEGLGCSRQHGLQVWPPPPLLGSQHRTEHPSRVQVEEWAEKPIEGMPVHVSDIFAGA